MCQVFLPEAAHYPHVLETELRLYGLTGGKVVTRGKDLPKGSVDLIMTAMRTRRCGARRDAIPGTGQLLHGQRLAELLSWQLILLHMHQLLK